MTSLKDIKEKIQCVNTLLGITDLDGRDTKDQRVIDIVTEAFMVSEVVAMAEVRIARINARAITGENGVDAAYATEFERTARLDDTTLFAVGMREIFMELENLALAELEAENEEFDRIENMSDEERFDHFNPNWEQEDELVEAALERQIRKCEEPELD